MFILISKTNTKTIAVLIEDLYTITYDPLKFRKLELCFINLNDYNKDEPLVREIFLVNRYLELYRAFKFKIFINASCFIESDSSDDEEEPPESIEESYKTDNCVICQDKEPNILFADCNHICVCLECVKIKSLANCPYCRNEISRRIKI